MTNKEREREREKKPNISQSSQVSDSARISACNPTKRHVRMEQVTGVKKERKKERKASAPQVSVGLPVRKRKRERGKKGHIFLLESQVGEITQCIFICIYIYISSGTQVGKRPYFLVAPKCVHLSFPSCVSRKQRVNAPSVQPRIPQRRKESLRSPVVGSPSILSSPDGIARRPAWKKKKSK